VNSIVSEGLVAQNDYHTTRRSASGVVIVLGDQPFRHDRVHSDREPRGYHPPASVVLNHAAGRTGNQDHEPAPQHQARRRPTRVAGRRRGLGDAPPV